MQTINVSNNQQVDLYNYNYGDGQPAQPATPPGTIQSRNRSDGDQVQSDPGDPRKPGPLGTRAQLATLSGKIDALSGSVNTVKNDVNGVRTDVNAVRADVAGVKAEVGTLAQNVNGVSGKVDGVQSGVTDIRSGLASLDKDVGQIGKNIDTLKTQGFQNAKDLNEIKTALGNLAPRIEVIEAQTSGLQQFEQWVKDNCKASGSNP
jgi:outer membrane murein-binding lipoprotein Lpp